MKPTVLHKFVIQCVCGLVLTATCAGMASGQGPGKYIRQASDRLANMTDLAAKEGYSFRQNGFGFGGALLKKDTNAWLPVFTVQLTEGRTYVFLAAGDDDTRDLDLDIQDSSGKTLIADADRSAEARVTFTPPVSGRYTVRLRLYDSADGLPCYCIAAVMLKK
jgi:hypothetical protein